MSNCYIIYKTTNLVNGKIYVGKFDLSASSSKYKKSYLGSGLIIKSSIKKYGKQNFIRETLEYCTSSNVDEREIYWIECLSATNDNIGYNIAKGGEGGNIIKWTQDRKDKIRLRLKERGGHTGINNPNYGKGDKIKGENNPSKRNDVKEKIRNKLKGRIFSEDHKIKISENRKGINIKYEYFIENLINGEIIQIKNISLQDFCKIDNRFNFNTIRMRLKNDQLIYKKVWKIVKVNKKHER